MGLASLFRRRKKNNYFKSSIEPKCAYCQYGKRGTENGNTLILCEKKGPVKENESCRKFIYSPLKRIPVKQLNIEGAVGADEMYVEISDEELAAKQAAAAKADAAERAQEEATAKAAIERAAQEAKALAAAEQAAKADAEAKAKADAEAKAQAEAAAKAPAEAKPQTEPAAPLDSKDANQEIAAAAAAAEAALAGAQAAAPVQNAAPVQHAAPAQNAVPVQHAAPVQNAAPVQHAAPAQNAAPVHAAVPADLDDEFADLDTVDEADVVEAQEHEVMSSKKHHLAEEGTSAPKGPMPKLPPASAFIRNNNKNK